MISKGKNERRPAGKSVWLSWAMLVAVFAYMLALNVLMPLHRDDYEYALIWGTLDKIASWPDVYLSLVRHYFMHGGRMVAFAVLDSFLLLGKQCFNPLNALLFVALIALIYWHAKRRLTLRFEPYFLALIIFFCWFSFPQFASVNIWMTGACVYLLTAVLIFAFLLPYHLAYWRQSAFGDHWLAAAVMFPVGILAGWTVENTAVTATVAASLALFDAYRKKYLAKWMVSGFAGSLCGVALLTAAPGNYVRYGEQSAKPFVHVTNIIAGTGEMLLYMLPLVLFGLLSWRLLKVLYATEREGKTAPQAKSGLSVGMWLNWALAAIIATSYCRDKFVSLWLGRILIDNVAMPLGIATLRLQQQLANTLSGFEEMALYLLVITQLYKLFAKKLALRDSDLKASGIRAGWRELAQKDPAVNSALWFLAFAVLNNFVMLASPRFPGRATFGTVVFCIIAVMTLFSLPQVQECLLAGRRKFYAVCLMLVLLLPMAALTLQQYLIVDRVDRERIAYIEAQTAKGAIEVELAPLPPLNRVMLHVYYVELSNPVSKYGLCRFYGLRDLKITAAENKVK